MFIRRLPKRSFGILRDFHERSNIEFQGTHKVNQTQLFFTTPTRPGNFGEHIDVKAQVDNWFDENRIHNEEDTDVRKTQVYLMDALFLSGMISLSRVLACGVIGRLSGWKRYDRDTYLEVDIGELPPGEVIQIVWNGEPVFVRRLTDEEVEHENNLPEDTLLDKSGEVMLNEDVNTKVLVCSAICTHLGCIPIPYLGSYKGWVCICHGSVYDKYARVRQGPALENLKVINNSLYGDILCIEELKFKTSPNVRFYA